MARLDAEDIVSQLQEQLAEVREAEVSARQTAEERLASLSQEYNSIKSQVSASALYCCVHVTLWDPNSSRLIAWRLRGRQMHQCLHVAA